MEAAIKFEIDQEEKQQTQVAIVFLLKTLLASKIPLNKDGILDKYEIYLEKQGFSRAEIRKGISGFDFPLRGAMLRCRGEFIDVDVNYKMKINKAGKKFLLEHKNENFSTIIPRRKTSGNSKSTVRRKSN